MATYGDFKAFLAKNGIKKQEVAELLNITPQTLSVKLSGEQEFTVPQIRILCDTYKLSADIFLA
jgi:transcriptional regulator with XRE-family HTH domain